MIKIIISILISSLFCFSVMADENLDLNVLSSDKIDKTSDFKTDIQLIPKEEKEKMLKDKIEFLKKDIEKWKTYQNKLLKVKSEFEITYKNNEDKMKEYESVINDIKDKMDASEKDINKTSIEIDKGSEILNGDKIEDKIVEFNLPNGKKIKLIQHTVFPGETLSMIISKTFPEGYEKTYNEIEFRMKTVIQLNKNLKNKDQISSGQVIYIPFFKN